jgi:hypothetical protein
LWLFQLWAIAKMHIPRTYMNNFVIGIWVWFLASICHLPQVIFQHMLLVFFHACWTFHYMFCCYKCPCMQIFLMDSLNSGPVFNCLLLIHAVSFRIASYNATRKIELSNKESHFPQCFMLWWLVLCRSHVVCLK